MYCIIIYLSFLNGDWLVVREVQWFYWTQELLVPVEEFTVRLPMVRLELTTPVLQRQCSSHWAIQLNLLLLGRSWVYPVGVLHHNIFVISQLWLNSHPKSTVVLLDTGTPGTGREIRSIEAHHWHPHCKFLYCDLRVELTKAFKNFAKYIIAFIFAKFEHFAKQIIYLESPDI